MTATGRLPGDIRYTPWLRKFMLSELLAFILAMLAGLMLTGLVALRTRSRGPLWLVVALTASVGLFYALLFPAALAFSAALQLVLWLDPRLGDQRERRLSAAGLAVAIIAAFEIADGYQRLVMSARAGAPVMLSPRDAVVSKTVTCGIVHQPVRAGTRHRIAPAVAAVRRHRPGPGGGRLLRRPAAGADGRLRGIQVHVPDGAVPHAGGGGRRPLGIAKRPSMDALALLSLVVLLPGLTARSTDWLDNVLRVQPLVHESSTSLVLGTEAPDAGWASAVPTGTPLDTVVAVRRTRLLLPVLTKRTLFAPAEDMNGGIARLLGAEPFQPGQPSWLPTRRGERTHGTAAPDVRARRSGERRVDPG